MNTTLPPHINRLVRYYADALLQKATPNQKPTTTGITRPKTRIDKTIDDQRMWSALDVIDITLGEHINHSHFGIRKELNRRWRDKAKQTLGIDDIITDWDLAKRANASNADLVDIICEAIAELAAEGRITIDTTIN